MKARTKKKLVRQQQGMDIPHHARASVNSLQQTQLHHPLGLPDDMTGRGIGEVGILEISLVGVCLAANQLNYNLAAGGWMWQFTRKDL